MRTRTVQAHFNRHGAPALLVVIAILQMTLAHSRDLTPWKGGGFGMFSTVDAPQTRLLRCYLITEHGDVRVAVPGPLRRRASRLRAMPDASALNEVARALAATRWVSVDYDGNLAIGGRLGPISAASHLGLDATVRLRTPTAVRAIETHERTPGPHELVVFSAARVELWRYRFDLDPPKIQLYRERVADIAAPAREGEGAS